MTEMKFIGGCTCLDFVNTVGARVSDRQGKRTRAYADRVLRDKLKDYTHLLKWSQLAGLSTGHYTRQLAHLAEVSPSRGAAILARAIRLREALYRIFKSVLESWAPDESDVDVLRNELSIAKARERFIRRGAGFVWAWDHSQNALDGPLWQVSRSAADLLTSADLTKLRQCGGDECGWMFLDTSRNRSRRWCDMKDCGNRAKVRRFRRREGHR
jgi:predicted RNA-binding Zn ribbon-like protein